MVIVNLTVTLGQHCLCVPGLILGQHCRCARSYSGTTLSVCARSYLGTTLSVCARPYIGTALCVPSLTLGQHCQCVPGMRKLALLVPGLRLPTLHGRLSVGKDDDRTGPNGVQTPASNLHIINNHKTSVKWLRYNP